MTATTSTNEGYDSGGAGSGSVDRDDNASVVSGASDSSSSSSSSTSSDSSSSSSVGSSQNSEPEALTGRNCKCLSNPATFFRAADYSVTPTVTQPHSSNDIVTSETVVNKHEGYYFIHLPGTAVAEVHERDLKDDNGTIKLIPGNYVLGETNINNTEIKVALKVGQYYPLEKGEELPTFKVSLNRNGRAISKPSAVRSKDGNGYFVRIDRFAGTRDMRSDRTLTGDGKVLELAKAGNIFATQSAVRASYSELSEQGTFASRVRLGMKTVDDALRFLNMGVLGSLNHTAGEIKGIGNIVIGATGAIGAILAILKNAILVPVIGTFIGVIIGIGEKIGKAIGACAVKTWNNPVGKALIWTAVSLAGVAAALGVAYLIMTQPHLAMIIGIALAGTAAAGGLGFLCYKFQSQIAAAAKTVGSGIANTGVAIFQAFDRADVILKGVFDNKIGPAIKKFGSAVARGLAFASAILGYIVFLRPVRLLAQIGYYAVVAPVKAVKHGLINMIKRELNYDEMTDTLRATRRQLINSQETNIRLLESQTGEHAYDLRTELTNNKRDLALKERFSASAYAKEEAANSRVIDQYQVHRASASMQAGTKKFFTSLGESISSGFKDDFFTTMRQFGFEMDVIGAKNRNNTPPVVSASRLSENNPIREAGKTKATKTALIVDRLSPEQAALVANNYTPKGDFNDSQKDRIRLGHFLRMVADKEVSNFGRNYADRYDYNPSKLAGTDHEVLNGVNGLLGDPYREENFLEQAFESSLGSARQMASRKLEDTSAAVSDAQKALDKQKEFLTTAHEEMIAADADYRNTPFSERDGTNRTLHRDKYVRGLKLDAGKRNTLSQAQAARKVAHGEYPVVDINDLNGTPIVDIEALLYESRQPTTPLPSPTSTPPNEESEDGVEVWVQLPPYNNGGADNGGAGAAAAAAAAAASVAAATEGASGGAGGGNHSLSEEEAEEHYGRREVVVGGAAEAGAAAAAAAAAASAAAAAAETANREDDDDSLGEVVVGDAGSGAGGGDVPLTEEEQDLQRRLENL